MWASCYIEQIQVNAGATGPSWLGPAASSIPLHWLTLKETRCIPHCYSFLSYLWGSCCLPLLLWPGRASVLYRMGIQAGRCPAYSTGGRK